MNRWIKRSLGIAAGIAGAIAVDAAVVFHQGFHKASDRQMKCLSEDNDVAPEILDQIKEGIHWFNDQPVREVSITSFDGLILRGHYLAHPQARRTVIAVHGYKSHAYYDWGALTRFYYESGCNLLLVEQRAHRVSEGEYVDMGIFARYDVVSWVRYINSINDPSLPVFLLGVSMGAATVMMAGELPMPANVKGIIDDCGYSDTWEEVRHFGKFFHVFPTDVLMPIVNFLCRIRIGFSLRDASPRESLRKTHIPVLMIHGTADTLVPINNSYENYAACKAPKRLVQVEGAEHGTSYFTDQALYEQEVLDFFSRCGA